MGVHPQDCMQMHEESKRTCDGWILKQIYWIILVAIISITETLSPMNWESLLWYPRNYENSFLRRNTQVPLPSDPADSADSGSLTKGPSPDALVTGSFVMVAPKAWSKRKASWSSLHWNLIYCILHGHGARVARSKWSAWFVSGWIRHASSKYALFTSQFMSWCHTVA